MKICPKCGKEHQKPGIYCSRQCANSHKHTEKSKQKIRESLSKTLLNKGIIMESSNIIKCPVCGKEFLAKPYQKFCSISCASKSHPETARLALKKANKKLQENNNWGGYRNGSGRAKSGYYKGIYCGSTYELVWVIYQLDHNLAFERFKGILEWNNVKYIPDFLQNGNIIEIKGYEDKESVDKKTKVANHCGYNVIILREENLTKEFNWVKTHYTFKKIYELYDDYKPKFKYICSFCGKEFFRDKKISSEIKYCSRSCSGKGITKKIHAC